MGSPIPDFSQGGNKSGVGEIFVRFDVGNKNEYYRDVNVIPPQGYRPSWYNGRYLRRVVHIRSFLFSVEGNRNRFVLSPRVYESQTSLPAHFGITVIV